MEGSLRLLGLTKKILYPVNRYYSTIVQRRGGPGGQVLSPPSISVLSFSEKQGFLESMNMIFVSFFRYPDGHIIPWKIPVDTHQNNNCEDCTHPDIQDGVLYIRRVYTICHGKNAAYRYDNDRCKYFANGKEKKCCNNPNNNTNWA